MGNKDLPAPSFLYPGLHTVFSEVEGGPKPDILPKNGKSPKEAKQNKKGNNPIWKWVRETERDQN